jgi:hypothetical protein
MTLGSLGLAGSGRLRGLGIFGTHCSVFEDVFAYDVEVKAHVMCEV